MSTAPTARPRWPTLLAWLVIAGVVGFILYRQAERPRDRAAALVLLQAEGRRLVAMHNVNFPGATPKMLYEQAEGLVEQGDYSQRLRLAILAGELVGAAEALRALGELERERQAGEIEARPASVEAVGLLRKLYTGYEKEDMQPRLPDDEQATLRRGLGWFGDLALAPEGGDEEARAKVLAPAYRTLVASIAVALGVLFCLALGGFLMLLVFCLAVLGHLRGGLTPDSGNGGVYAETFAAYMLLYLAINYVFRLLPVDRGSLALNGAAMLLSLAALAWPVVRGVPWRVVRRDLGLGAERPLVEVLFGVGCYLTAVPVVAAGAVFIYLLTRGKPPGAGPTHPVIGVALEKGWLIWVQVFVVACVLAPLVEEVMFRGALYRHLREASAGWGRVASVAASALASGLIFAAIHPQGWLAVPVLGGLAVVFALAREWRGWLAAPMVAHGLNNGVSTLMLLLMAG